MLSLDQFLIEHIAQCIFPVLVDGKLRKGERTYESMCDLAMFARTCHYVHDIIKHIMHEYAQQSSTLIKNPYGLSLYVDSLGRMHNYYGPVMVSPKVLYAIDGRCHRITYPAVEYADGMREWYRDGKLHREDGPAIEYADGMRVWYLKGKLHRKDDPAVEYADGTHVWYLKGKHHREDGPAIERADGTREWYQNDKLHRDDGPTIEDANGTREWYREGSRVLPES